MKTMYTMPPLLVHIVAELPVNYHILYELTVYSVSTVAEYYPVNFIRFLVAVAVVRMRHFISPL